jgi:hypothetical protein
MVAIFCPGFLSQLRGFASCHRLGRAKEWDKKGWDDEMISQFMGAKGPVEVLLCM